MFSLCRQFVCVHVGAHAFYDYVMMLVCMFKFRSSLSVGTHLKWINVLSTLHCII
jgi:hypothetical protein